MTNFDFLKDFNENAYNIGVRIDEEVSRSPAAIKAYATSFLEGIVNDMLKRTGNSVKNERLTYKQRVDILDRNRLIPYNFKSLLIDTYNLRSRIHDDYSVVLETEQRVAIQIHKNLHDIAKKYYRRFCEDYDEYRGLPKYVPPTFSNTDEINPLPEWEEIENIRFDNCIICGKLNSSSYSNMCSDCLSKIENAQNLITIKNNFGDKTCFTWEDLVEFGIPEAYVHLLINDLNNSNVVDRKGRFYYFNEDMIESYLNEVNTFLEIGGVLTRFYEDKISNSEIKDEDAYKYGNLGIYPYVEFYKLVNDKILDSFICELEDGKTNREAVLYSKITQEEINHWYDNEISKDPFSNAFICYNNNLIGEYLILKSKGHRDDAIKAELCIDDDIFNFWLESFENGKNFSKRYETVKRNLIIEAIRDNKTIDEAIEIAGITIDEFRSINDERFIKQYNMYYVERRQKLFLIYLKHFNFKKALEMAKIRKEDFDEWYTQSEKEYLTNNISSKFYISSTKLLMQSYLEARRNGKSKQAASEFVGLNSDYINYWLRNDLDLFKEFQQKNLKCTVDIIINEFRKGTSKKQASCRGDISVTQLNQFLKIGERGSSMYRQLFETYEKYVVPMQLEIFLKEIKSKSFNKALELAFLDADELNKYYEIGEVDNDSIYHDFSKKYDDYRLNVYFSEMISGNDHENALNRSLLSVEEYEENKKFIDNNLLLDRINIVLEELKNNKTTNIAAKHAGLTADDVYDWYLKGRDSDDIFSAFSECYYDIYMKPNISSINNGLKAGIPIKFILKKSKSNFTQQDYKFWEKLGYIEDETFNFDLSKQSEENDDDEIFLKGSFTNTETFAHKNEGSDDIVEIKERLLKNSLESSTPKHSILKNNKDDDLKEIIESYKKNDL